MPELSRMARYTVDLSQPMGRNREWLMMEGDRRADTLRITVMDGQTPVNLSGASAVAYVDRTDGNSIYCAGTVSDNVVSIPLIDQAYSVPGSVVIRVTLSASGTTRTIFVINGYVEHAGSGVVLDPSGSLPTIEDIAAALSEIRAAITSSSSAANAANTAAGEANTAAGKANTAAGAANTAAGNADKATSAANSAASSANTAAGNADKATSAANTAAGAANTAAGAANTAADAANDAKDAATSAASAANTAASAANTAAGNASDAADAANAAATSASGAATAANQAAEAANSAASGVGTVLYNTAQALTGDQQAQARANIGAASTVEIPDVSDVLRFSAQSLTEEQQRTARFNIGAADAAWLRQADEIDASYLANMDAAARVNLYNAGTRVLAVHNNDTTVALALLWNGSTRWLGSNKPVRNLLDNSDFTNPVNQRGQSSYTGAVYGIDRWKGRVVQSVVSPQTGNLKIEREAGTTSWTGITQTIGNIRYLRGKTLTLAMRVYTSSADQACVGFVDPSNNSTVFAFEKSAAQSGMHTVVVTYQIPSDADDASIGAQVRLEQSADGAYMRAYWAALYEGAYTADTLPPYTPKGCAAELAECRRYYWRLSHSGDGFQTVFKIGGYGTVCPTGVPYNYMRVTPSVEKTSVEIYGSTGGWTNATVRYAMNENGRIAIMIDGANDAQNDGKALLIKGITALSADL